jgi:hypothetical protein
MLAAAFTPALPIAVVALIFGLGAGIAIRYGAKKLLINEEDKLEMKRLVERKYRKEQYL